MRRIHILGIVLALVLVLVSAAVTIALAKRNGEVHYGSMASTTWFASPDHPDMSIEVIDVKWSPFGTYDFLGISIYPDVMVMITDNEDVADWLDDLFGFPDFAMVVEDAELEVWRERGKGWWSKGKTLFAELTVEVEVSLYNMTIEPLSIVFEGTGSTKHGTETEEMPGFTMTASWTGYNAFVTVVAHVGTPGECEQMTLGLVATHMEFSIASTPP